MIAQAKQQNPQLAALPDEMVAMLILQAMQDQQAGPPTGEQGLDKMSAKELVDITRRLCKMDLAPYRIETVLLGPTQGSITKSYFPVYCV